jgi:hypothetical protein
LEKNAHVKDHMEISKGIIQNMSFARAAQDWEVDTFALFYRLLYLVRMRWEGEDRLWWISSKRRLFDVKSFYSVISCHDGFHFL